MAHGHAFRSSQKLINCYVALLPGIRILIYLSQPVPMASKFQHAYGILNCLSVCNYLMRNVDFGIKQNGAEAYQRIMRVRVVLSSSSMGSSKRFLLPIVGSYFQFVFVGLDPALLSLTILSIL